MNNTVFGRTMENVRKHSYIKLVEKNRKSSYFVFAPNYHARKCFSENILAIEMNKIEIKMNKTVYLRLSILEISRTRMHVLWYNCIKPR